MAFINVGARLGISDIPTKKALKDAISANPEKVVLYGTSMFDQDRSYKMDDLVEGIKYTVVGPNPYTSRKWYATVELTAKGIKVS